MSVAAVTRPPPTGRVRADQWAWVAMGVGVLPVLVYLGLAAARIGYPYELEWMEGGSVELARRVAAGQPLYGPPSLTATPWAYPPLYPMLGAAVGGLVGQGFLPLRLVSVAASVVVLAGLAVLLRQVSGRWLPGIAAAGVVAAGYGPAGLAADVGRVDSLMLALLVVAIAVARRARTAVGGLLVGVCLVAAVATKQTAAPVAVVVVGWLVWRRPRAGLVAAGVSAVLLGLGVAAAQRSSDGWFVDYVVALLPGHPLVPRNVLTFWSTDVGLVWAPVIALGIVAVSGRAAGRLRIRLAGPHPVAHPDRELLVLAAAALLAVAWAGRVHSGGAANVLLTAHAGVALLTGLAVARLAEDRRGLRLVAVALAAQVAVTAPTLVHAVPTQDDRRAGDEVVTALAALPGRVVLPDHPHYLTLAGKEPTAHTVALADVWRGGPSRARDALLAARSSDLTGVQAIVLDRADDLTLFDPAALAGFERVKVPPGTGRADPAVFSPVGGIRGRPSVVLVRRGTELSGIDLRAVLAP